MSFKYASITHFSIYLWCSACFAESLFIGSSTSNDLTNCLASSGEPRSKSSKLGKSNFEFDLLSKTEPNPEPMDFTSSSVILGIAATIRST